MYSKQLFATLFLLAELFSCTEQKPANTQQEVAATPTAPVKDTVRPAAIPLPDSSNPHIYRFLQMVIRNRNLNRSYGISLNAEANCSTYGDDRIFLRKELLIKKEKKKPEPVVDSLTGYYVVNIEYLFGYERCLTPTDINDMLWQQKQFAGFKWNNERLGFNLKNRKNWYSFSVPLFSRDGKKAVVKVSSLCPGLCGTGNTLLYIKKKGKWVCSEGPPWWH